MNQMIRQPICAGTWYPTDRDEIKGYLDLTVKKEKVIGAVCPHAGWAFSGRVAGDVFSRIEPTSLYILIGPNHTGFGKPVSVFNHGAWMTPLGDIEVDDKIANLICKKNPLAQPDLLGHLREHSLEVQLPFIKYIKPDAKIVPISLSDYDLLTCMSLGDTIAQIIIENDLKKDVTLVASTDMSHYVPAETAKKLDASAIKKILNIAPEELLEVVQLKNISMCGSGPTAVMLRAAQKLGARCGELVRYATSGDVTGENRQVVAYAGIVIK
jgi:MEMO1 family protein